MHDTERLEMAITELSTCATPWQRPSREKLVLLYGGRVYQWTQETTDLLTKQLRWLDTQVGSPTYETRFAEWQCLLKQYERACDALAAAAALNIGCVAA